MNDSELLDWLDQQENLVLAQDKDSYWYIRRRGEVYSTGYPFIRQAIQVAKEKYEANRTL